MAFANQFVVSVLVNGKPQREFPHNGQRAVTIPFGSEYKVRLKNQSHRKALVNISIDGASIFSGGKQLILASQQSIDLERFVDDLNGGNKFKFVSRDQAAMEGHFDPTSSEMGLLKVEFVPEMEWPTSLLSGHQPRTYDGGILRSKGIGGVRGNLGDSGYSSNFYCSTNSVGAATNASFAGSIQDLGLTAKNDSVGGTVEGNHSSQQFGESKEFTIWAWGQKTTIGIQLKGPGAEPSLDFGYAGLAKSIKKGSQEYLVQSVMTTTDGSITVIYK